MSAAPALSYIIGIGIFTMAGYFLNNIKEIFVNSGIHQTGDVFSLMQYIWAGMFIIFLVGGGIYVIRRYSERQYQGGI